MCYARSRLVLRFQIKTFLLIFAVAISNALVLGASAAHDADPDHTSHECSVCISAQLMDDAPPATAEPVIDPHFYTVAKTRQTLRQLSLEGRYNPVRARAPPYSLS